MLPPVTGHEQLGPGEDCNRNMEQVKGAGQRPGAVEPGSAQLQESGGHHEMCVPCRYGYHIGRDGIEKVVSDFVLLMKGADGVEILDVENMMDIPF